MHNMQEESGPLEGGENSKPRQIKRFRRDSSESASEQEIERADELEMVEDNNTLIGTQLQPVEISSRESSSVLDEPINQRPGKQDVENIIQSELQTQEIDGRDGGDVTGTSEPEESHTPRPISLETLSSSDYPSNTPTPKAPRHKASVFDTQAILSSPSQAFPLSRLPRPPEFTQPLETQLESTNQDRAPSTVPSSPIQAPSSIASPTQSLEEFRRSLNDTDAPEEFSMPPNFAPIPRPPRSPSPAASDASSTNSGDPDPPLRPDEFDDYFKAAHELGSNDQFIIAALKHTRCRPGLTDEVLAAWKVGQPLPDRRGIWSKEDDEDVEDGDVDLLKRLEGKHTLDGWGGVTERILWLEQYRNR